MSKIAVVGDPDSILSFAAVGFSTFEANDSETARKTIRNLATSDFGIIYITEYLAEQISDEIEKYRFQSSPAILSIPGMFGNTGAGMKGVYQSVEKAVGSNIL